VANIKFRLGIIFREFVGNSGTVLQHQIPRVMGKSLRDKLTNFAANDYDEQHRRTKTTTTSDSHRQLLMMNADAVPAAAAAAEYVVVAATDDDLMCDGVDLSRKSKSVAFEMSAPASRTSELS